MIEKIKDYVPTLGIRISEMSALEHLPGATKDRMTPCILLAPWANSKTLGKAMNRVHRAFPRRHYFLDIDQDYCDKSEKPAQQEFAQLKEPNDAFSNWREFVKQYKWVWPCLQSKGQSEADIHKQIETFVQLGRIYCVRIFLDRIPNNLEVIISALAHFRDTDFVVILEGGWVEDALSLAGKFKGHIDNILEKMDIQVPPKVPVVLSCTSMPKGFTHFKNVMPVEFNNRKLVNQIAEQSNRAHIIYGDWASTRPRNNDGGGPAPKRIDYPTTSAWYIARNQDEDWDFKTAAEELIARKDVWNEELDIWGTKMIEITAANKAHGITTPQKNVASRVNIHLHRQAFYDDPEGVSRSPEEDWEDLED